MMNTTKEQEYYNNELAEKAMNAAIRLIQDEIGVESGDEASVFFSGDDGENMIDILTRYIKQENNS